MKRVIPILLCLLAAASGSVRANAAGVTYGYLNEDTTLYTATADGYAPLFTMPRTYFVAILSADKNGYTAASWLDATGYVKTAEIEAVDYTPVTKYPSRTLSAANDLNPVNIRSAPDHTQANVVGTLPDGGTAVVYGETTGTKLIPQVGNRWFYIRYTADDVSLYGYVYSAQVAAETISDNVIERETPPPTEPVEEDADLNLYAKLGVIAALTIPAVIVMFVIFRPAPKQRKPRKL